MEVLLEYKASRRQLAVADHDSVCDVLASVLRNAGWQGQLMFGAPETSTASAQLSSPSVYILQRWTERWNTFVDVENVMEVKDGDRLTVNLKPVGSPVKACMHTYNYSVRMYLLTASIILHLYNYYYCMQE